MATPTQITKKPIPRNQTAWQKEVEGWRKFIQDAKKVSTDQGDKWKENMLRYARQRLEDLLNHPAVRATQAKRQRGINRKRRG